MKKNLSFSLSGIFKRFRQNVSLTLLLALIVLLLFEAFVVRRSVQILLASTHIEVTPKTQSVRVNFHLYDAIAQRFNQETAFATTPITVPDPFGLYKFEKPAPSP